MLACASLGDVGAERVVVALVVERNLYSPLLPLFEVANDTDICYLVNPDCTVVYAARMGLHYETSIIPAGEYTGIAEFTVSVEPKVM